MLLSIREVISLIVNAFAKFRRAMELGSMSGRPVSVLVPRIGAFNTASHHEIKS
jgi:hypothetical protein